MSLSVFPCQHDPLVNTLRDVFKANIVRLPEERIQPLCAVASSKSQQKFIGSLPPLIAGEPALTFEESNYSLSRMTNIAGTRSQKISLNIGLEVLGNFLQAFGIPSAGIESELQKASKVSFSFQDVIRKYIDLSWLGSILAGRYINGNNPVARIFLDQWYDFLVISSIITSSDFSIHMEAASREEVKLNIPLIQSIVQGAKVGVEVSSTTGLDLQFKGEKHLTFAFSCVVLYLDREGKISAIPPDESVRTLGRPNQAAMYIPNTVLLEEKLGMLSWD